MLTLRYPARCVVCQRKMAEGEDGQYDSETRTWTCESCVDGTTGAQDLRPAPVAATASAPAPAPAKKSKKPTPPPPDKPLTRPGDARPVSLCCPNCGHVVAWVRLGG